jgi:atypical dual specificity phosphatase
MTMFGVSQVSEIQSGLYLTSVYGATRDNILKKHITLLINSAQELPKQEISGVESIKLFLDDTPFALINVYFDRMADKINEHLNRGGKVMVHCVMGVSRSTSLVLAYLMKYKRLTLRQAYELVSQRRTCVRPNPGFWRQLLDYEKRLTSVKTEPTASTTSSSSSSNKYGTPIPIQIESSSTSSSSSNNTIQQERQSLINALTLSNNYTDFRPFSSSRMPGSTTRSSSSNNNGEFNSRSSMNYSSYVNPVNQHRTSLIPSTPSSKYVKPANFSTTYRSSYGRY